MYLQGLEIERWHVCLSLRVCECVCVHVSVNLCVFFYERLFFSNPIYFFFRQTTPKRRYASQPMACVDLIRGCYTQKHVGRKIRQMQIKKHARTLNHVQVIMSIVRDVVFFGVFLVISREKKAIRSREVHKKCKSFKWE